MGYTTEENIQILISLMKKHGVRNVVASPGTTNATFVASLQNDSFFRIISSVDERSAAYIACGISAELNEPVALSCTGATASRNYVPGLTEAYYRKLPILAITSMQHPGRVGQLVPQVLDRTEQMNDICVKSVQITTPHCSEDAWQCNLLINDALLALKRDGCGPVHINLQTSYSTTFNVSSLPEERVIRRYYSNSHMPEIPKGRIAVFIGAHLPFSLELQNEIELFCTKHDAVVLCDQTSNYRGRHRVLAPIITNQDTYIPDLVNLNLIIHIGQVSGASMRLLPKNVWRVSPDGEVRDAFKKLTAVFEMEESLFFEKYNLTDSDSCVDGHLLKWKNEEESIREKIPELPFSNLWIASQIAPRIPDNCAVHLAILNTLRSWNMFETPETVQCFSNTGGFGIDGNLSSALGASIANPNKLFFCFLGDLSFFYDMNALGNRHLSPNLRIMLINNGRGTEFHNYCHMVSKMGEMGDEYLAAAGHFGGKSRNLVSHYAQDLGVRYLHAECKEELLGGLDDFLNPEIGSSPLLFEVFTDSDEESDALKMVSNLVVDARGYAKKLVKAAFGQKGINAVKEIMNR